MVKIARCTALQISPEDLAYWYLRLNGFLMLQNFIVHPDQGGEQRTDADILGVRFPHRSELMVDPMVDDELFTQLTSKPYLIAAEVKRGLCALNGPWKNSGDQNLHRVLRAIGAFPQGDIHEVAEALYEKGFFANESYHFGIVCFGQNENVEVSHRYPQVPQVLWSRVLAFIHHRFRSYRRQKASHGQWDLNGIQLWECAKRTRTVEEFAARVTLKP